VRRRECAEPQGRSSATSDGRIMFAKSWSKEGRCKIRDERFSGGGHCLWKMPEMADTRMRYVTERRSVGGRISTARRDGDGTGGTGTEQEGRKAWPS
jgi:hypothetical protein